MAKKNFSGGLSSLIGEALTQETIQEDLPNTKIQNENREVLETLKIRGRPKSNFKEISKTSEIGTKPNETRATFIVKNEYVERIKSLAYWERKQVKTVVNEALEMYFSNLNPQDIRKAEKAYRESNGDSD